MGTDVEPVWLLREFRKTNEHGNAGLLSRLPAGSDLQFDGEEVGEDVDNKDF